MDINECELRESCGSGARCINERGSHRCECPAGFTGDPHGSGCVDVDECSLPNACGINAICSNSPGTYSCTCPKGFKGDAFKECSGMCLQSSYSHYYVRHRIIDATVPVR